MSDKTKKLQIRNSTAEFLTFTAETGAQSVEVIYADETVWATQDMMAVLYDTTKQNISLHLNNAFADGEIIESATVKEFLTVQKEGSRDVQRTRKFYNLDAIISVGFKVNSTRAVQFRQWAIALLILNSSSHMPCVQKWWIAASFSAIVYARLCKCVLLSESNSKSSILKSLAERM